MELPSGAVILQSIYIYTLIYLYINFKLKELRLVGACAFPCYTYFITYTLSFRPNLFTNISHFNISSRIEKAVSSIYTQMMYCTRILMKYNYGILNIAIQRRWFHIENICEMADATSPYPIPAFHRIYSLISYTDES